MTAAVEDPWTVHIAGPVIGPMQSCGMCGDVLVDNTPWFEGRVGVMEGEDRGPSWWPEGHRVAKLGGCSTTIPDRPLEADEVLCAGAN